MARMTAKIKMGYYPLAEAEAKRIRRFLEFREQASVIDPCAGTGAALVAVTAGATVQRFGIELDAHRAAEASTVLDHVIAGDAFETHSAVESFSVLLENPPYDHEIGEGKNQRFERLFLEHTFRWLRPGGVLVLVVPAERVWECRTVLSAHFKEKAVYRLTEPEAVTYRQAVVFGIRRSRQERDRLSDDAIVLAHRKLAELTRRYEDIPALPDVPDRRFQVPASEPAKLEYRGLPLDIVEDLLAASPAWLQARRITHAPRPEFGGRPLTPLHRGHCGILCASSMVSGEFGQGADRHLAEWSSVKVIDRFTEETEEGVVIRERERFSQRLVLLFADGRSAVLSEKPGGKRAEGAHRDGECAPADGTAAVRAPEG